MNANMFYLNDVLFTVENILYETLKPTLIVRAAPTDMNHAKSKILRMVSRYGAEFRLRVQSMFNLEWVISCDTPEIYQEDGNPFEYVLEFDVMPENENRKIVINRLKTMEKGFNGPFKLDVGLQEDVSLVSATYMDDARHGDIRMPDGVTSISFPISLYRLEEDDPETFSRIMTGVMNILRSDIQRTRPMLFGLTLRLYYTISVTSDESTSKIDIYWVITGINDAEYNKINFEFMMYHGGDMMIPRYPSLDQFINNPSLDSTIYTTSDLYSALYSNITTGYYVIPSYIKGFRTTMLRPDTDEDLNYIIKPVQLCLDTDLHLNNAIAIDFDMYNCHEEDAVWFYKKVTTDCDYYNYVGAVGYTISDDCEFIITEEDIKYILDLCGTLELDVILIDRWNHHILFGVTDIIEQLPDDKDKENDENEMPVEQTVETNETIREEDIQLPMVIDDTSDQVLEKDFMKLSKQRKSEIIKDVIAKMFGGDKK